MQLPQLLITACITTHLVNCSCNQLARDTPSVQGVYLHQPSAPQPSAIPLQLKYCPNYSLVATSQLPYEPITCINQLIRCLVHQCAFLTLICEPMPCRGAHGLDILLAPTVRSSSTATSHGIASMTVSSQCIGHCALVPCIVLMSSSQLRIQCPIEPWHCAHGFSNWLVAQGLGALVPTRGGGRPHQAPFRCGHRVHAAYVVEPMCACLSVVRVSQARQDHAMVPHWCSQGLPLVPH